DEDPRSGLANYLDLGILLVHAELVQGHVLCLLDGAPDGLDPLHLTGPAWTGDCRSALHPSPLPHFRSGWSARSGWSWPTWASAWAPTTSASRRPWPPAPWPAAGRARRARGRTGTLAPAARW